MALICVQGVVIKSNYSESLYPQEIVSEMNFDNILNSEAYVGIQFSKLPAYGNGET